MKNNFLNNLYHDIFDYSQLDLQQLENTKFNLLSNFVLYFNCTNSKTTFDYYLDNQIETITNRFKELFKNFVVANNQTLSETDLTVLQYYFPNLGITILEQNNISQSILEYFNYHGTLQSGLIYYSNSKLYFLELSITNTISTFDNYFESFYNQINEDNSVPSNELYSPIYYEPDEIDFDENSKKEIQLIVNKLNEIRNKGNFLALLPVLEKHLLEQNKNNTKISRLYIDQNYNIWLTDYNLEVKLSHLTKTIYFLFLSMENKIHISDLKLYKKYLINIYLSISNQDNLDKMLQSIDLLLNDKNAIYVHLSRIKSTFHKLIHKDIAEKYCISGAKDEPKSIPLEKKLTNIDAFLKQWEIDPSIEFASNKIIKKEDFDFPF